MNRPTSARWGRWLAHLGFAGSLVLSAPVASAQERALPAGVTAEVQAAVDRGLDWLARNQGSDGAWRSAGGYGTYPAAMTGLAGMAFVTAGSLPTRGKHWREVRRAVDFLLRCADPSTGLIAVPREEDRPMYGHGFATLLLASVYGMEEDARKQERLKGVLDRAVALVVAAQSPAGGWHYRPDANDDEGSVTVTQLQALRACRMAGILVDKRTIDRAVAYVKRCQNGDGSVRYSLASGPEGRPAITAAGIAVLYSAGVYDEEPFVDKAFGYCSRHIHPTISRTQHEYYTHCYWSQALYQRGGQAWNDYYEKRSTWLCNQQQRDGSWNGDSVGTVYGTALALVTLQLPHALAPIYQR